MTFSAKLLTLLFLLPLAQRIGRTWPALGRRWEIATAVVALVTLVATVIDCLPQAHWAYMSLVQAWTNDKGGHGNWSWTATGVVLSQVAGLIVARSKWLHELEETLPRLKKLLFAFLCLAAPALFVFAYFELCRVYVATSSKELFSIPLCDCFCEGGALKVDSILFLKLLLGCAVTYAFFVNANFTSLHRYYRNRLAETYLLRRTKDAKIESREKANRDDKLKLSALRKEKSATAPYHLINAALNLPASTQDDLRGRDCDFFLLSKLYCGSRVSLVFLDRPPKSALVSCQFLRLQRLEFPDRRTEMCFRLHFLS